MSGNRPIQITIGPGELLDRLTILKLKAGRLADVGARARAQAQLEEVRAVYARAIPPTAGLDGLLNSLADANTSLWELEDRIRELERNAEFGREFVQASRAICRTNDRRADLKKQIDILLGSPPMDEKHYGIRS